MTSLSLRHNFVSEIEQANSSVDGFRQFPKLQSLSYRLCERNARKPSQCFRIASVLDLVDSFLTATSEVQGRRFPILRTLIIRSEPLHYPVENGLRLNEDDMRTVNGFRAAGMDVIVQDVKHNPGQSMYLEV